MKNILITGGTDGIGKGLALHYASQGNRVFVVGSNPGKGKRFETEASNAHLNITFIQANLSLVSENKRIVKELSGEIDHLDMLILCAASLKAQPKFITTEEDLEFTFALYYMSRYTLSHKLIPLLEKSTNPVILNIAAPGMKTKLYRDDFQMKNNYNGQDAQFHGSRLNDLLGVSITHDYSSKIKYVLFNPMAARTSGANKMSNGNKFMNLYYKFFGKNVDELAKIISDNVDSADKPGLYAFKLSKSVNLKMKTFDYADALTLDNYTKSLCQ